MKKRKIPKRRSVLAAAVRENPCFAPKVVPNKYKIYRRNPKCKDYCNEC